MKITVRFELMKAGRYSADIMRRVNNTLLARVTKQTGPMFQSIEIMVTDDTLISKFFRSNHQLSTHSFPVTIMVSEQSLSLGGDIIVSTSRNVGNCLSEALNGKILSA